MTTEKAIEKLERMLDVDKKLKDIGINLPGTDENIQWMEKLLEAVKGETAREDAAEANQTEEDKEIEKYTQLNLDTVFAATRYIESVMADIGKDGLWIVAGDDRYLPMLEYPMHTALAALKKVEKDLVAEAYEEMSKA